jgi:hypothetical protein
MERRRIKRLQRGAQSTLLALQETWTREAVARLADQELRCLSDALRREEPLEGKGFGQLPLSPEEQAAFERFNRFYEEARRGS